MNGLPLVSMIVPIFDVERYLERSVRSIMAQTHANLEIILVDDESPDACPKMCDEFAREDGRVKVIHKKNGGLSDARNAGLAVAKGEYVAFVDSDDYVSNDFIKNLYSALRESGADVSCCGFYKVFNNGSLMNTKKSLELLRFTNKEAIKDIFSARSICEVMTWNKLYKRDLFEKNGITFPSGKIHEDNFTTYKLLFFSSCVVYIDDPLYYYTQRTDSIMGRNFDIKRLDALDAPEEARVFFKDNSMNMQKELQSAELLALLGLYSDYLISGTLDIDIDKKLDTAVKSVGNFYINNSITLKHKMLFTLLKFSPTVYKTLRVMYKNKS